MADDEGNGFFDNWPDWAKPVVVLAGFALWIVVPLVSALKLVDHGVQSGAPVDYQPMMAVLIAMTTATIAGIFLFMTFRIDRGARFKAEHSARDEVNKKTEDIVRGLKNEAACELKKTKDNFVGQTECLLEQAKKDLDQRRLDAERVLEAVDASDLLGMGDENQRVDVTFCDAASLREPRWKDTQRVGPDAEECDCPLG